MTHQRQLQQLISDFNGRQRRPYTLLGLGYFNTVKDRRSNIFYQYSSNRHVKMQTIPT